MKKAGTLIAFLILVASMYFFLARNEVVCVIAGGVGFIVGTFLLAEFMADKTGTEKVVQDGIEVYLVKQQSLAGGSFYSRTVGILHPMILFDKDQFSLLTEQERKAVLLHEAGHVKKKHQLKRFLLLAGMILLLVVVRCFAAWDMVPFIIAGFVVLALFFVFAVWYYRKNEFDADSYAVSEMKDAQPLTTFLTERIGVTEKKGLSLHPSVNARVAKLK